MGPIENLDRFTCDDLTAFYRRWYRPENITLVVAGDVKTDDVAAEAMKLFRSLTDRIAQGVTPLPIAPTMLPGIVHAPPRAPERLADRALVSVFLGFPMPMAEIKDQLPALDTLLNLLVVADQPQGRLDVSLVQKGGRAISVSAEFVPGNANGLLILSAIGAPRDERRLEESLVAEVHRLRDVPVTQDEVDDARLNAAANVNGGDSSLTGLAHRLANQDTEGMSHEMSDDYAALIGKVTADSINKLVEKYLSPVRFAVAAIGPPPISKPPVLAGESR